VAPADLDGDGDLDALIANEVGAAQEVWLNQLPPAPEIDVRGKGQSIPSGSTTPSTANGTDFGSIAVSGSPVVHTFTISNTGSADLNLSGTPIVALSSGTHFVVSAQPVSSTIAPGGATAFEISFDPAAAGRFTDTVGIANNDADENPYTFVISGTGTEDVAPQADLALTKVSERGLLTVTYTVVARNLGPAAADGAVVSDTFAAEVVGPTWTCAAAGGASCTASGSGDILDTLASFPVGGVVTYTAQGSLGIIQQVDNEEEVIPPAGITDPDLSNNRAMVHTPGSGYHVLLPIVLKGYQP
jgi:uncharacterized repeat protein (TIGR01451 family)